MRLDEALTILKDSGYIMEAVKNETETLEIPVCRKDNNVVFWRIKAKVDLDKDEYVIADKYICFGHPSRLINGKYDNNRYNEGVPESATRSPSSAVAFISKHPEWGSATVEDFKKVIEERMKRLNDNRLDDRKRRSKSTVTMQFKEEFDALLKKYGAVVKGSCWSSYDPAQGNVWIEIENGDDFDLMDLDDHGEYKGD